MAYRVITPPVGEPITLEEAKAHLRVVFSDEDAQIGATITAARQMLERRLNRVLMPQVVEAEVAGPHDAVFPVLPARAVVSLSYVDPTGVTRVLAPSEYLSSFYREPPTLAPVYGTTWPAIQPGSAYLIRYEAGYASAADVPGPLKQWMLLAIGAMYENRESVVAGVSVSPLPEEFMHWLWHPYMVYA